MERLEDGEMRVGDVLDAEHLIPLQRECLAEKGLSYNSLQKDGLIPERDENSEAVLGLSCHVENPALSVQQGCAPTAGGEGKLLEVGGEINKNLFAHLKADLIVGNS